MKHRQIYQTKKQMIYQYDETGEFFPVFANEDDMNSLLCNFDVAPYTVSRIEDNEWIEEYSA